ncbi:hypothetical protein AAEX28_04110 [Lentisphaerota bacterium WC36G]|nr:hypothetical protein LJT99_06980 [Lentisphaerae bacterium WC36]
MLNKKLHQLNNDELISEFEKAVIHKFFRLNNGRRSGKTFAIKRVAVLKKELKCRTNIDKIEKPPPNWERLI